MNRIHSLLSFAKKYDKKIKIKKIVLYALLIFVLMIPLFLAILSMRLVQNRSDSISVTIYESDGTLIATEEGLVESAARHSLLESFYNIQTNKKEISYAPGNPADDPYILAIINLNGSVSEMQCYFSLDGTSDYLIEASGKIYTVSSLYTKSFLASSYAASFYEASLPPLLTTVDNDTVIPSKVNWSYQNNGDKFVPVTNPKTVSDQKTYDMTGGIGLHFSHEPDQCTAYVYTGGRKIYEGDLSGLPRITVDTKSELNITVNATWKQKTTTSFYGTVQYDFLVHIRNRSDFTISSDTVYPGEWILLSGTNISDPSNIEFVSDWCKTPIFFQDGESVYTLLPIPENLSRTSLQFEIAHGASARTFRIALRPKQGMQSSLTKSDFLNPQMLTQATLQACLAEIRQAPTDFARTIYFRGKFQDPTQDEFTIGYRHGDIIEAESEETITMLGTEFLSSAQEQSAYAWNHGMVVLTGQSSSLGNYAVIDHGCGLRTWYCHLSRLDVNMGDAVQKGQALGTCGTDGLATGSGYLLICTINQTVIDPSFMMGQEIKY